MRQPDFETQHLIETLKSLNHFGTFGLKFVQIANGGAAIALLAYLGDITSSTGNAPNLLPPMKFFVAGLLLGGLAAFTTYFTQLSLYNEGLGDVKPGGHRIWLRASMALSFSALIAFGIGCIAATRAFAP